jgi:hypothetical protein
LTMQATIPQPDVWGAVQPQPSGNYTTMDHNEILISDDYAEALIELDFDFLFEGDEENKLDRVVALRSGMTIFDGVFKTLSEKGMVPIFPNPYVLTPVTDQGLFAIVTLMRHYFHWAVKNCQNPAVWVKVS